MPARAPRIVGLKEEADDYIQSLIEKAYQRGAEDMRAMILNAAGDASVNQRGASIGRITTKTTKNKGAKKTPRKKSAARAPQGAVEAALTKALTKKPGIGVSELQKTLAIIDPRVSVHSVAPTLRRLEGSKFVNKKGKWSVKK